MKPDANSLQSYTRHGCGPGATLPADTVTEGARLPRRTREELEIEFFRVKGEKVRPFDWDTQQRRYLRLADLAGQIARTDK